jgi:putative two-component system response regulator
MSSALLTPQTAERSQQSLSDILTTDTCKDTADENKKARVLVADGSPTVRKILRHTFASLGWEMIEAEDGEQALRMASTRPYPNAILVDLNLRKIDGYEVCRRLKADLQFQLIPLVALIPTDSNEEKIQAVEAGADEILSKPMNRAEVNVRLRSLIRMHKFNQEVIGAESVAMALARAVASKDGYSSGHVEATANYAVMLGAALEMDPAELKILRYGAILHNVGKIAIPDAVLEKTGPLTPREKALFQQHPRVGCDICAPLKPLKAVLPIIRHHKEHFDGTGYPDGLRGEQIPLAAQIVGIVDVYSALTSDRPFRSALSQERSIEKLRARAENGIHDPQLVERFIRCLEESRLVDRDDREQESPRADEGEKQPVTAEA